MSTPSDHEPAPFARDRRVSKTDRRALTLRTLFTAGLAPRRRGGRRVSDEEIPVDFYEPRLLVPVLAMLLLSVADAFLTVRLMAGGAEEMNPLLAFVLNEHPRLFAVVKMALTGLGVVVLVALARARVFKLVRVSLFLYALVAAYFALIVYEAQLLGLMS